MVTEYVSFIVTVAFYLLFAQIQVFVKETNSRCINKDIIVVALFAFQLVMYQNQTEVQQSVVRWATFAVNMVKTTNI